MKENSGQEMRQPRAKPRAKPKTLQHNICWTPARAETFTSETGECMTRLFFHHLAEPLVHSADKFFKDALECPAILAEPLHWMPIKPWLANDPDEIAKFWHGFTTQSAITERMRATGGTKAVNWVEERKLIGVARATKRLMDSPEATSSPFVMTFDVVMLCKLGEWVVNSVHNDIEAPRRLHQLLKDPTAADEKLNRDLLSRNVFEAFARLVATERRLPRKCEVREAAFIGSDNSGRRQAARACAELGLGDLPEG